MEVVAFDDATEFRAIAEPFLLAEEAPNNLILGVTGMAARDPDAFDGFIAWLVTEVGKPVAVASRTPPHNLILAVPQNEQTVSLLADEIGDIPGVVGVAPWVHRFVEARPERAKLTMSQGIFRLEKVIPPPPGDGVSRPATTDEIDMLLEWRLAFEKEAHGHIDDPERSRRGTEWRVKEQSPLAGHWVHEVDGRLVSMSGHSGATPSGIRIGPVYTPPDQRGMGYASHVVAAESQWLLDNGHRFCFLYTDLANPTSNAIYTRIGYRQIAESAEYSFSPTT